MRTNQKPPNAYENENQGLGNQRESLLEARPAIQSLLEANDSLKIYFPKKSDVSRNQDGMQNLDRNHLSFSYIKA